MPASSALKSTVVALLLAAPALARAQATIVPHEPVQFERVSLRQTVDSCMFDEDNVRVRYERSTIIVLQPPLQCFAPGPAEVVDIQLGAFPPGDYRVEIRLADDQPPIERIDFTVWGLVQILASFPPSPFPLADYSGVWWTPAESGWGLSLHQGRFHELFGAIYVFGAEQQPQWYTLSNGRWLTSTRWSGDILRTTGPAWSAPTWDADAVKHNVAGRATLDFTMTPGREDVAELSYTIGGTTVRKQIARVRF